MNRQLTKLSLVALLICLFSGLAYAQEPSGYYKKAEGKSQKELLKQLCEISDRTKTWATTDCGTCTRIRTFALARITIGTCIPLRNSARDSRSVATTAMWATA